MRSKEAIAWEQQRADQQAEQGGGVAVAAMAVVLASGVLVFAGFCIGSWLR